MKLDFCDICILALLLPLVTFLAIEYFAPVYRKVGGLHFFRIGKLSLSFCITKK